MPIIEKVEDWHAWRRAGLGSSDAPIIMKASPWMTPIQLWEEKRGQGKPRETNWAQQRGIDTEAEARANYELKADVDMEPALAVHWAQPYLRASLDGYNAEVSRVLEIKCPGKDDHQTAVSGQIPTKYVWQLVHQLMVTGAEEAHYFSYHNKHGVIVPFRRNQKLERELFDAERAFWDLVQSGTPPELTDRDYEELTDPDHVSLFSDFRSAKKELEMCEARVESLKKNIIEIAGGRRLRCEGVTVAKVFRKGNVDYSKIEALKGLDLEPFRKKGSEYVEVRVKQ